MTMGRESPVDVELQWLTHGVGLALPAYQTEGAAGVDLSAAVADGELIKLEPGSRKLVPTGLAIALPQGFEAQVRPRSGLALHHGVTVLNAPGTIDSDYRGEIKVMLINHGQDVFLIERGMRIAQMVVSPVVQIHWREVGRLTTSTRAKAGFGSTGLGLRGMKS